MANESVPLVADGGESQRQGGSKPERVSSLRGWVSGLTRGQIGMGLAVFLLVGVAALTAGFVATRKKSDDEAKVHVPVHPATGTIVAAALNATVGYDRLGVLCDTFGHRLSGSANLEAAIEWVEDQLGVDGFDNVEKDPVQVPVWVRGSESLSLLAPAFLAKDMAMLGLGGSGPTPNNGTDPLIGPVVVVESLEEAKALPDNALNASAFLLINQPFTTYGATSGIRREGPAEGARAGAMATLVRSVTPYSLQSPHTGSMSPAGAPGAAVTVEDAELISRLLSRGVDVTLRLQMEARTLPDTADSFNVMGQITGSEFPDQFVVMGGHIDSWDVGTGALDDGGGVLATWEALRVIKELGLVPRRTIRFVAWTNEENGAEGAKAYASQHADELNATSLALESDSGVFAPKGFGFTGSDEAFQIISEIISHIDGLEGERPLASTRGGGGVDIQPMMDTGVPGTGLNVGYDLPDSYYFYFHHTTADTFDKIELQGFQECVAAIAALVWEVANLDDLLPR